MKQSLKTRVFNRLNERIEMGLNTQEEIINMARTNWGQCQVFAGLIHDLTQYVPSTQHETVVRYIREYKARLKARQSNSQV